jgi:hypothetical protein
MLLVEAAFSSVDDGGRAGMEFASRQEVGEEETT